MRNKLKQKLLIFSVFKVSVENISINKLICGYYFLQLLLQQTILVDFNGVISEVVTSCN